jgi:hypothetical protein
MVRMFSFTRISVIATGLTVVAAAAWAYIPPAPYILHEVAKKHTSYTSIRVRTNIIGLDSNGNPSGVRLRETTVSNSKEQSLHSWVTDETGKVLYHVERFAASNAKSAKMSVVAEVLFDNNSVRLGNSLKSAGITFPRGKSSTTGDDASGGDKLTLRRWNRSAAWVFGKTAQLWIEKDTFIPVRVIAPGAGDSQLLDFQMENFRQYDELAYPRLATLYEAAKKVPLLKAELMDLALDPGQAALAVPKERAEGFTEAGQSAPAPIRELIETYYRLIR